MMNTEISDQVIEQALERPESFGYSGDLDLFNTWGLCGPSQHRDSDILTESNYATIVEDLEDRFPDDVEVVSANHWAVGWVEQLAVRVLGDDGKPTEAFEAVYEWNEALKNYPIADESDFSRREYEDCLETIEFICPTWEFERDNQTYAVNEDMPDDWLSEIFGWLFNNKNVCRSEEVSDEDCEDALIALKWACPVNEL